MFERFELAIFDLSNFFPVTSLLVTPLLCLVTPGSGSKLKFESQLARSKLPVKIPTLRDKIAKWGANEQTVLLLKLAYLPSKLLVSGKYLFCNLRTSNFRGTTISR